MQRRPQLSKRKTGRTPPSPRPSLPHVPIRPVRVKRPPQHRGR